MPTATTPIAQPTRPMIERLLRELARGDDEADGREEYHRLYREKEELGKRLLDVPEMREARRAYEAAYSAYQTKRTKREQMVRGVRQLFLANGLTPAVLRELNLLLRKLGHSDQLPKK